MDDDDMMAAMSMAVSMKVQQCGSAVARARGAARARAARCARANFKE